MEKSSSRKNPRHHRHESNSMSRYGRTAEQNTAETSHAPCNFNFEELAQNNSSDTAVNRSYKNLYLRRKRFQETGGEQTTGKQSPSRKQHWRNTDQKSCHSSENHNEYPKIKGSHSDNKHYDYNRVQDTTSGLSEEASVSHVTKTSNDSAAGSVVNGRYVRKKVLQNTVSQLNAEAAPFFPRTEEGVSKSKNLSHGTKQKYDYRKYSSENPHGIIQGNDTAYYHAKSSHFNRNSRYGYSRSKVPKNSGRRNSQIDKAIASGNEFSVEELTHELWGIEQEPKSGDKDRIVASSKSKESTTQRDRLISQLEKGECECLVCCEHIRTRDYIWSCCNCFHVFHLRCIRKWARSPTAIVKGSGWRCPACQDIKEQAPFNYYCFCGKYKEPEVNFHFTPHSCGEVCGKQREDEQCVHRCNILCHPGPCPPCSATISKVCACGKLQKTVPCAKNDPITCSSLCEKLLNCGIHTCEDSCHIGACKPCMVTFKQKCFCTREEREVSCNSLTDELAQYSCGSACGKQLACGNHSCSATCHPGPCGTCSFLPNVVTSCPCGKTSLQDLHLSGKAAVRLYCVDPVPLCGNKCEKVLSCGPKDNHHQCNSDCHAGDCPPCSLTTLVKCRCGATSKEVPCVDMVKSDFAFQCAKRCNRRKDCGRHKCLNTCCINLVHKCELVCNKKLTCGLHHCQETCHAGNCPTCWNVSFYELSCYCGHSVLHPPIPCGTKPPECNQPCTRSHPCDHKVQHTCHSDETCPPCTVLTVKWCFGRHERRSNVQCFLDGISCGKLCDKPLPCGQHKCREVCHAGHCLKSDSTCSQPCVKLRSCGHPCFAPCHVGPCPESLCKAKVEVSCPCGQRCEVTTCSEDSSAYRLMSVSILASKMQDIKAGESVSISDILGKKGKCSRLQCNEECAVIVRNKRLAVALQIQNPDLSCKPGPPNYSEFLKEEAKKNLKFVSNVYDKFCELVQLAKQSKQKSRSYAFPPMKRDQRRVIHELAEFFGCETQSYDEEPVKNVVITAFRDKSWLPFVSITTVIERDMGLRRGPTPVMSHVASKPPAQVNAAEKKEKVIDYFDYTG